MWSYNGLSAEQMGSVSPISERASRPRSTISSISSRSRWPASQSSRYFPAQRQYPDCHRAGRGDSQALRQMPPGITPPLIIKYSASSIPVIQLGLSSGRCPSRIVRQRHQLSTAQTHHDSGRWRCPTPMAASCADFGGSRYPGATCQGITPTDVINAVSSQNLILPAGSVKMGETEYAVHLNGSPETIEG